MSRRMSSPSLVVTGQLACPNSICRTVSSLRLLLNQVVIAAYTVRGAAQGSKGSPRLAAHAGTYAFTDRSGIVWVGSKGSGLSAFDPAAGKDIYEPDKIIAQRMAKGGVTQYQVKWVGYDSKANTWEPLEKTRTSPAVRT